MHGRIRGGDPEQVMDDAVRAAVAERLAGQDVLLVAADRERCRELARRVRDDLIHLGLVDDGPAVRLAEGAEASRGDLVIARKNDHRHGIANGDVLLIDRVGDDTVALRKAMDRDPGTGAMRLDERQITYGRSDFSAFDLGYCITGHSSMGRTVTAGIPVVTGNEDRQWLYTAMTRGAARNYAYVMSQTPRKADPAPGAAPAPELARYDRQQRLRDGRAAESRIWLDVPFAEKDEAAQAGARWDYEAKRWYAPEAGMKTFARWDPAANRRDPAAVLADVLRRDGAEKSASEIWRQNRQQRRPPRRPERHLAGRDRRAANRPLPADPAGDPAARNTRRRRDPRLRRHGCGALCAAPRPPAWTPARLSRTLCIPGRWPGPATSPAWWMPGSASRPAH